MPLFIYTWLCQPRQASIFAPYPKKDIYARRRSYLSTQQDAKNYTLLETGSLAKAEARPL